MNRERLIEQSVSDAITEKPIRFSVRYKEERDVTEVVVERQPVHKYIPFIKRSVEVEKTVRMMVDIEDKFEICPPTLGKMQILSSHYLRLEIDEDAFNTDPMIEAMRIAEVKMDDVCKLMAVATCNTKEELLNDTLITQRAELFKWNADPTDYATCVIAIRSQIDYANFMNSTRLLRILRLNAPSRADQVEQSEDALSGETLQI